MKQLCIRFTMGAALMLAIALVGVLPVGPRRGAQLADAAGACPINVRDNGSTTLQAIRQAAKPVFEAQFAPGTTVTQIFNGSGNGIADLTAGNADTAGSSRPLKFSTGETTGKYVWQVAKDSFVIGVHNSPAMQFLVHTGGLQKAHLTQIYNAGAGISTLHWTDLVPSLVSNDPVNFPVSTALIVPRARITGSGSQPDFIGQISVPAANEDATIVATGLPREVEALQMADDASANDNQIVYTSLSQVANHPNMLVVAINGVIPDFTNVLSYALPRALFYTTRDNALVNRIDNSQQVRADDFINFLRSPAGDALIAAEGYPTIPAADVPPIPDWDVNLDGNTSLGDLGAVASHWGLSSACKGWIRADGNNDGKVSLSDIGVVTSHWGQNGLICDGVASLPDTGYNPGTHDCQHG
jgi:ABC-type phosphate transport system substrate-binding protein